MEKKSIIDKTTLIPIGLVITICGFVWFTSGLNSRVTMNTGRVEAVETTVKETPSRIEFNDLKEDITEIKQDIKTLLGHK